MQASKDNGQSWNATPDIGTIIQYRIISLPQGESEEDDYSNLSLGDFSVDNIKLSSESNIFEELSVEENSGSELTFSGRINTSQTATSLVSPEVVIDPNTIISYTL